jgi:phosphatidylethanolamine/phosphatidyl-N-methylethanolamine N-methyltransferase
VTIFSLGMLRDSIFKAALDAQPTHPSFVSSSLIKPYAALLFVTGNVLVLSSMWALGVTGTYLGDYFGILMDEVVTGFPFNVSSCPMYLGSTLCFLGTSLWFGKVAGVLLTAEVWVGYVLALKFEE